MYFFFFTARDTQESAHAHIPTPTYSYLPTMKFLAIIDPAMPGRLRSYRIVFID